MKETNNDTERKILDAAIKEFSTKGFDGARTANIASEAGVTHAMLHYYFRTKERLFQRIFQEKMRDIINMLTASITKTDGNIRERITTLIENHFEFLRKNSTLPVFLITTLNSRPELYTELINSLYETYHERVDPLQKEFDKAADAGEIKHAEVQKLLCDIAALNVFPFIATSLAMAIAGFSQDKRDEFLESRKKENIETILKRIS